MSRARGKGRCPRLEIAFYHYALARARFLSVLFTPLVLFFFFHSAVITLTIIGLAGKSCA